MSPPVNSEKRGQPPRRALLALSVVAIASLPYVTLLAANVGEELDTPMLLLWWGVTLATSLAVLAGLFRLPGHQARWFSAVLVVLLYLLFNLPGARSLRDSLGWQVEDLAAWFILAGAVLAIAVPLTRLRHVQSFVLLLAPLLLVAPSLEWVSASVSAEETAPDDEASETPVPVATEHWMITPNVWYIVLDGLASVDFVREQTGHDGTAFAHHLGELGFHVSPEAESNYPITFLSVSAALDMRYVFHGVDEPWATPFYRRLQGGNKTVDAFLAHGYSYTHTFPGLWNGSRCSGREDLCFSAEDTLNDTELALAATTPLGYLLETNSDVDVARANSPEDAVARILAEDFEEPAYHFVHLLNPHPPYVRDASCRVREVELELGVWGEGAEYGESVACLNRQITAAVEAILEQDDDPLIIIQGDHGPRFGIDRTEEDDILYGTDMFFSIFSAVRLPSACADIEVPDDLTPVNNFRIAFACLRGEQPELLPNVRHPIIRD